MLIIYFFWTRSASRRLATVLSTGSRTTSRGASLFSDMVVVYLPLGVQAIVSGARKETRAPNLGCEWHNLFLLSLSPSFIFVTTNVTDCMPSHFTASATACFSLMRMQSSCTERSSRHSRRVRLVSRLTVTGRCLMTTHLRVSSFFILFVLPGLVSDAAFIIFGVK